MDVFITFLTFFSFLHVLTLVKLFSRHFYIYAARRGLLNRHRRQSHVELEPSEGRRGGERRAGRATSHSPRRRSDDPARAVSTRSLSRMSVATQNISSRQLQRVALAVRQLANTGKRVALFVYTKGDSDVISCNMYASWFPPPSFRYNSCLLLWCHLNMLCGLVDGSYGYFPQLTG